MEKAAHSLVGHIPVTRLLADWISRTRNESVGPVAFEWAKHVLLDWLAVTIAAAREPLVRILAEQYGSSDALPCSVIASGLRARPHDAALVNGSAGHALDYDDVASGMSGHPSVPVVPAALAQAQLCGASGLDLLRALIVGHEVEVRVGEMLGPGHYRHGFHATGTVGTFGAAAACASLRGLSDAQAVHALGLAATQAAGLKCMFGTMAKPLHAGKAAMNGWMAAQLASAGFTAGEHAIECSQGFVATMAPQARHFVTPIDASGGFAIQQTLFKYHASCYLTHSTIEAVRKLRQGHGIDLSALASMSIRVAGNHRGVCDIDDPRTGLELKFAIRHLAALALDGADTGDIGLYTDDAARRPEINAAAKCIELVVNASGNRDAAIVTLATRDGRHYTQTTNVAIPASDLSEQWTRLQAKAATLVQPILGPARFERLVSAVHSLDRAPSLQPLFEAIQ